LTPEKSFKIFFKVCQYIIALLKRLVGPEFLTNYHYTIILAAVKNNLLISGSTIRIAKGQSVIYCKMK
jgi:hypothetical protein